MAAIFNFDYFLNIIWPTHIHTYDCHWTINKQNTMFKAYLNNSDTCFKKKIILMADINPTILHFLKNITIFFSNDFEKRLILIWELCRLEFLFLSKSLKHHFEGPVINSALEYVLVSMKILKPFEQQECALIFKA